MFFEIWKNVKYVFSNTVLSTADRTAYDVYGITAEPEHRKFRVCNIYGHLTKRPMAIPCVEISQKATFTTTTTIFFNNKLTNATMCTVLERHRIE